MKWGGIGQLAQFYEIPVPKRSRIWPGKKRRVQLFIKYYMPAKFEAKRKKKKKKINGIGTDGPILMFLCSLELIWRRQFEKKKFGPDRWRHLFLKLIKFNFTRKSLKMHEKWVFFYPTWTFFFAKCRLWTTMVHYILRARFCVKFCEYTCIVSMSMYKVRSIKRQIELAEYHALL